MHFPCKLQEDMPAQMQVAGSEVFKADPVADDHKQSINKLLLYRLNVAMRMGKITKHGQTAHNNSLLFSEQVKVAMSTMKKIKWRN
jgi:hypothetical protein